VFSNHYHFIATSPKDGAENLSALICSLHRRSAYLVNKIDQEKGRKIWHNYREPHLTYEKSYLARLHYVLNNPVHHGLVQSSD